MASAWRSTQRGLGLASATPEASIVTAARAAEQHRYHSFWLNNTPQADALEPLGRVARVTETVCLGVGVIPLSNRGPSEIVRDVQRNDLALSRFYLGIGSGSGPGGVQRVADGIHDIRAALNVKIVIAALGPKMCRLAGAQADGVLLNWLTPDFARSSIDRVGDGALEAGRPVPRLTAYVRVAMGDGAIAQLRHEAGRYESIPSYAEHFKRMGAAALDTTVTGHTPDEIQHGLAAWDGVVDEVVVRAITSDDSEKEIIRLLDAARPLR